MTAVGTERTLSTILGFTIHPRKLPFDLLEGRADVANPSSTARLYEAKLSLIHKTDVAYDGSRIAGPRRPATSRLTLQLLEGLGWHL